MNSPIKYLVVHTSATKPSQVVDEKTIDTWHKQRGFKGIGYHYVILRDGEIRKGRPDTTVGAHVAGKNTGSLGICLIGGLNQETGKPEDNYTEPQYFSLRILLTILALQHPKAEVLGHRDLSPDLNGDGKITSNEWVKECPCFTVKEWWAKRKAYWLAFK